MRLVPPKTGPEAAPEHRIDQHSIANRHYQKTAIQAVCETLSQGHRHALLVMATGTGKTRTAISLVDLLTRQNWIKNVLFLADRRELVKQAKKNFAALLPSLSICNLLDSKDSPDSRMVFSTYPTMMNAIDKTRSKDGSVLFTPGHFDLIIVDEAHRSIYKKYQDIFTYFDGFLVGLTATPKTDIDHNTYVLFELENNVPTYAYELIDAVDEGFLVSYTSHETKMKFLEQGIVYDELSEQEKEEWEDTFDEGCDSIDSSALNAYLKEHTHDLPIHKLRHNKELTAQDLSYLEKVLWQDLGTKAEYEKNRSHSKHGEEDRPTQCPPANGLNGCQPWPTSTLRNVGDPYNLSCESSNSLLRSS